MEVFISLPMDSNIGEQSEFEREVKYINDSNATGILEPEPDTTVQEEKKKTSFFEKNKLVTEVVAAELFGRHRYKKSIISNREPKVHSVCDIIKKSQPHMNKAYRSPGEVLSLTPACIHLDTMYCGWLSLSVTASQPPRTKIVVEGRIYPLSLSAQYVSSCQAGTTEYALGRKLFSEMRKQVCYRVMYRGKYYLFDFDGGKMKNYCEVGCDSS